MQSITENLKAWGCDVKGALERVVGDERLYISLLFEYVKEIDFDELEQMVAEGRMEEAFETAHSMKGAVGNMGITPLYGPVSEITELLRVRSAEGIKEKLVQARVAKATFDGILEKG